MTNGTILLRSRVSSCCQALKFQKSRKTIARSTVYRCQTLWPTPRFELMRLRQSLVSTRRCPRGSGLFLANGVAVAQGGCADDYYYAGFYEEFAAVEPVRRGIF
jgi:hypothetical protein